MGLGKALKKIGHAIEKPFKEVGHGWWTDVRYPVLGAAAGALTAGVALPAIAGAATVAAGGSVAAAGAIGGSISSYMGTAALVGAGIGNMIGQGAAQRKLTSIEQAAAERAAQQQYNASLQPAATPDAVTNPAVAEESYSADRKRRFSLSRTTMQRASLLGSSGTGRTTLG